MKNVKK